MARKQAKTPFDRTKDFGSAREGVAQWWVQRVTAVALIPLTFWFATSLIARSRDDYGAFILWFRNPLSSVLMVLLLIAMFYHMALGLRVVVEVYVHVERIRVSAVVAINLTAFALAVAGIMSTLRICFV